MRVAGAFSTVDRVAEWINIDSCACAWAVEGHTLCLGASLFALALADFFSLSRCLRLRFSLSCFLSSFFLNRKQKKLKMNKKMKPENVAAIMIVRVSLAFSAMLPVCCLGFLF